MTIWHHPYEPVAFARRHGIALTVAWEIIDRHGQDRETCDREAERVKGLGVAYHRVTQVFGDRYPVLPLLGDGGCTA